MPNGTIAVRNPRLHTLKSSRGGSQNVQSRILVRVVPSPTSARLETYGRTRPVSADTPRDQSSNCGATRCDSYICAREVSRTRMRDPRSRRAGRRSPRSFPGSTQNQVWGSRYMAYLGRGERASSFAELEPSLAPRRRRSWSSFSSGRQPRRGSGGRAVVGGGSAGRGQSSSASGG